jgi:hypothetical protein
MMSLIRVLCCIAILEPAMSAPKPDEQAGKDSGGYTTHFNLISTTDATCIIQQNGQTLQTVVISPNDPSNRAEKSLENITLTLGKDHKDFAITCSRPGYRDKTSIVSWGPVHWSATWAPRCKPDLKDIDNVVCVPQHTGWTEMSYPDVVRVILELDPSSAAAR